MRVEFFMDPASGWAWSTPGSLVEDGRPRSDEEPTGAPRRPAGQGLVQRLLGRLGAWFGVDEQTPSGAWRRLRVARRDPWDPGARHSTVWSWWCP
jgi:hypothetical protein